MHENNSSQASDALLRLPQVLSLIPVSRSEWWAGVAAGRYPRAIKISPRVTVWRASEIYAYIRGLSK